MLELFWVLSAIVSVVSTEAVIKGVCGTDSIPYRITVNASGSAEIDCASPVCLGNTKKGLRSSRSDRHTSRNFNVSCTEEFKETVCSAQDEWTGGLIEVSNGTHVALKTKCCTLPGLKDAEFVKTVNLHHGDEFQGGFYAKYGTFGGFDLVKEVRKKVDEKGVKYVVTIVRIPCILDEETESLFQNDTSSASSLEEDDIQLSRSKRRLGGSYPGSRYEEYIPERLHPYVRQRLVLARSAPLRRWAPIAIRRRNLRRLLEDLYEDYEDEDYYLPPPRTRLVSKARTSGGGLWPFPVETTRPKVYAQGNIEASPYDIDEVVVEDSGSSNSQIAVHPPAVPPSDQMGSVMVVPKYVKVPVVEHPAQTGPVPPPDTSIASNQQLPASSNSYVAPMPVVNNSPAQYAEAQAPQPPPQPQQQQVVYQPAYQPAYQSSYQYSYPSYSPGYSSGCCGSNLNGLFSRMQCFTGKDKVETQSGPKMIKDVEIGDMVLSMDENMVTYSPVIMFLHKIENENATFVEIETKTNILKLTEFHLIYKSNCDPKAELKLVAAKEVTKEDCVYVLNGKRVLVPQKVIRIGKTNDKGIYAPLTASGDIFVNGVLASCHSNLAVKTLQQTFFSAYRGASSFFRRYMTSTSPREDIPLGVDYLTSVIDLFLPSSYA